MINIVLALAGLYFAFGIGSYIYTTIKLRKYEAIYRHNEYHRKRAVEYLEAFEETKDNAYMDYYLEEVKKLKG